MPARPQMPTLPRYGPGAERAVVVLPRGEPAQALVDGPLGRRRDHLRALLLGVLLLGRGAGRQGGRQAGERAGRQDGDAVFHGWALLGGRLRQPPIVILDHLLILGQKILRRQLKHLLALAGRQLAPARQRLQDRLHLLLVMRLGSVFSWGSLGFVIGLRAFWWFAVARLLGGWPGWAGCRGGRRLGRLGDGLDWHALRACSRSLSSRETICCSAACVAGPASLPAMRPSTARICRAISKSGFSPPSRPPSPNSRWSRPGRVCRWGRLGRGLPLLLARRPSRARS